MGYCLGLMLTDSKYTTTIFNSRQIEPNNIWNFFYNLRAYIKFSILSFLRDIVLFFIIIFVSYKYELFSEWELQYKKLLTDIGGCWFVIGLGDVYMKS